MTLAPCPVCAGPHLGPAHPYGVLAYRHALHCGYYTAEDRTALTDDCYKGPGRYRRPATATERALLEALGYAPGANQQTEVRWPAVRRRTWPGLHAPDHLPDPTM